MQYYYSIILVHRPFISERYSISEGRPELPRTVCLQSAIAISKLIRLYEKNYTLQHINIQAIGIIFSAALVLLFANISLSQTHDYQTSSTHLDVCSQALSKLGEYFENASRSLDLLLTIKRNWKARLVSGSSW